MEILFIGSVLFIISAIYVTILVKARKRVGHVSGPVPVESPDEPPLPPYVIDDRRSGPTFMEQVTTMMNDDAALESWRTRRREQMLADGWIKRGGQLLAPAGVTTVYEDGDTIMSRSFYEAGWRLASHDGCRTFLVYDGRPEIEDIRARFERRTPRLIQRWSETD